MCSLWDWYSYFEKTTIKPRAHAGHQDFSGAVVEELSVFWLSFEFWFILFSNSFCRFCAIMAAYEQIYQLVAIKVSRPWWAIALYLWGRDPLVEIKSLLLSILQSRPFYEMVCKICTNMCDIWCFRKRKVVFASPTKRKKNTIFPWHNIRSQGSIIGTMSYLARANLWISEFFIIYI